MNDMEMMGAAYYSYAMENAFPPVKEAARFIAPSNAEHGVLKTIRSFIEQGSCPELLALCGLTPQQIADDIVKKYGEL